jgi:hypothetical protein
LLTKGCAVAQAADCRIGADAGRHWLAGYQAIYPWCARRGPLARPPARPPARATVYPGG